MVSDSARVKLNAWSARLLSASDQADQVKQDFDSQSLQLCSKGRVSTGETEWRTPGGYKASASDSSQLRHELDAILTSTNPTAATTGRVPTDSRWQKWQFWTVDARPEPVNLHQCDDCTMSLLDLPGRALLSMPVLALRAPSEPWRRCDCNASIRYRRRTSVGLAMPPTGRCKDCICITKSGDNGAL